jgi:hypothetical protein
MALQRLHALSGDFPAQDVCATCVLGFRLLVMCGLAGPSTSVPNRVRVLFLGQVRSAGARLSACYRLHGGMCHFLHMSGQPCDALFSSCSATSRAAACT